MLVRQLLHRLPLGSVASSSSRRCGAMYLSTNATAKALPSNLHLAQVDCLVEKPKARLPIIPPENFFFPPLEIASTIDVAIFNQPGTLKPEKAPIDVKIFGVAIRKDIVHEVVRYQRHKARQPKKTKRMSEISGSNKKPRPQKGGGAAQVGHKRNSVWRGGQKAHGPVLRDYSIGLNRKYRAFGMMVALAAKFREGNLIVFDQMVCDTHRTKDLHTLMVGHGIADSTILFVDDVFDEKFLLACKNIATATTMLQTETNVYDILKREKMALSLSALIKLQQRILEQYGHQGRRHALLRDLYTYTTAASASPTTTNNS